MTITADDLDKTVVAQWGSDGGIRAVGKLVGYYSEPVAYIVLPDGTEVAWAANLCREATAEEASKQS